MDLQELLILIKTLSKTVYEIFENNPEKFIPMRTKSGTMKNITGISLFHMLTDHFAYHRGQIVTLFKEITGKEGIGTDYASFLLEDNPDIDI